MTTESVQQDMKTILEVIKGYYDLIEAKNRTKDKSKLEEINKELEGKKNYILNLLKNVNDAIEEEKKNVSY